MQRTNLCIPKTVFINLGAFCIVINDDFYTAKKRIEV